MKIIVVSAEKTSAKGLKTGKEKAFFVRCGDRNLLYGFGTGKTVLHNLKQLGVSSDYIETAFLPRADAADGLACFLQENRRAKVYARVNAFDGYYRKGLFGYKAAGVDKDLTSLRRILRCKSYFLSADRQFMLFSLGQKSPLASPALYKKDEAGNFVPDDFSHESYLVLAEGKNRVLFCGESKSGFLAVVREAERLVGMGLGGRLTAIVGGAGSDACNAEQIREISETLAYKKYPFYTDGKTAALLGLDTAALTVGTEIEI